MRKSSLTPILNPQSCNKDCIVSEAERFYLIFCLFLFFSCMQGTERVRLLINQSVVKHRHRDFKLHRFFFNKAKRCPTDATSFDVRYKLLGYKDIKI